MIATLAQTRTERGSVQNALLALLSERARHGYELRDLFEAALGGHWELNSGQIYSSLDRLARDGLVEEAGLTSASGPSRRQVGRSWRAGSIRRCPAIIACGMSFISS